MRDDRLGEAEAHAVGRLALHEGTPAWAEWVKDYYREVESYDWVDVADHFRGPEAFFHRNRARAVRHLIREHVQRGPILDAGCGTGLNLRSLPEGSTGLDINPRNIAVIRTRLPRHEAVLGDIEAMPFADGTFQAVLCTEVLEHVPDPHRALAEIYRVLAIGGVVIGSVPARALIWRLRFLSSTCPHSEPFHHEYLPAEVASMLDGWTIRVLRYSLLHFNVLFVAEKAGREAAARHPW